MTHVGPLPTNHDSSSDREMGRPPSSRPDLGEEQHEFFEEYFEGRRPRQPLDLSGLAWPKWLAGWSFVGWFTRRSAEETRFLEEYFPEGHPERRERVSEIVDTGLEVGLDFGIETVLEIGQFLIHYFIEALFALIGFFGGLFS